jgi:PAS domain-containing protein
MPTSSHEAARRAARVAARLAGRAELIHAVLDAAAHLARASLAGLWLDDGAGGAVSVGWSEADCSQVRALERAARAAAGRQLQRTEDGLALAGAPLQGLPGGLAVASPADDGPFEPREVALLAALGEQAGAALEDVGGAAPLWTNTDAFEAPAEAGWPDGIADGLLWLDEDGRVRRANRAALELLGRPVDGPRAAGQPLAALAGELPAGVLAALTAAPPAAVSACRLAVAAGAGARPRALTLVALPREPGRLVLVSDAAARSSVRGFEALVVSNAAHELRTPLTAIRAHAELIPDLLGVGPEETVGRFFQVIDLESQRMGGLLDSLRDALRAEGPSLVLHRPTLPEASS